MSNGGFFWKLLGVLVSLVTVAAPVYVAYDILSRGSAPEKHVELSRVSPIKLIPLSDLSPLGGRVNISLAVEGQTVKNLFIEHSYLRNIGKNPIVPSDYTEPLTVSVRPPWKIMAVENGKDFPSEVYLRWRRLDDAKFEATPALLNPGDLVVTHVYITNTKLQTIVDGQTSTEPIIEWKARIVNLRSFYEPPSIFDRAAPYFWGIHIQLSGWAFPFTIIVALLFQAFYLHLLSQGSLLSGWGTRSIFLVLATSLLSLAAAESMATYIFGNQLTAMFGVDHRLNAPPIILHILVLAFLYWRSSARRLVT